MSKFSIIFVRHGQTESNVQGKIQGQTNSNLTDLGKEQAHALAEHLKLYDPQHLYTSDLGRAQETAGIISEYLKIEPVVDPRIKETSFGYVEGSTWQRVEEQEPSLSKEWYHHHADVKFPGGESREDVVDRTMSFAHEALKRHSGGTIVAVTHGGLLAALFSHVLKIPKGQRPLCSIPNTSINIVSYSSDEWKIEAWGNVSHTKKTKA